MVDHLEEAKSRAVRAQDEDAPEWVLAAAQEATAHAIIALVELLAERLPPLAETASEIRARHRREELLLRD